MPTEVDNSFASVTVDTRNDLLATNFCPPEFVEERNYRQHHAIVPTFENWEIAVQAWAAGLAGSEDGEVKNAAGIPPTEESPLCNEQFQKAKRSVRITSPGSYSKIDPGQLKVEVKTSSDFPINNVTYYLDGTLQNISHNSPYDGSLRFSHTLDPGSVHTIKAVLTDENGYSAQSSIEVKLKGEPSTDEPIIIDEGSTSNSGN